MKHIYIIICLVFFHLSLSSCSFKNQEVQENKKNVYSISGGSVDIQSTQNIPPVGESGSRN